jgi:hypothetical protein
MKRDGQIPCLTGKEQGISSILGSIRAVDAGKAEDSLRVFQPIPYSTEQGIIFR